MRWHVAAVTVAMMAVAGCAHTKIAGTEIDDTKETRAVIDVVEKYRSALEARDARGIVALLAPEFADNGGSTAPDDDLDIKTVATKLPARLAKLQDVRVQIDIKRVTIDGETANVIYYFNANYKMPQYTSKVQADSDLKQMWFKRHEGRWEIVAGI